MIWWIDAQAGASGDMLLGALLDLHPEHLSTAQAAVDTVLDRMGAPGAVRLGVERTRRAGLSANRALVETVETQEHRAWEVIAAALDPDSGAYRAFEALALAEAKVHDVPTDRITFHEVGALDAIADIVAVTAVWEHAAPDEVVVSPVCVGSGTTTTAHGVLSVPVPAVVELLTGRPTFGGPLQHEACTPTGAALLATMATGWGTAPPMTVAGTGLGAGGRDTVGRPNILRILSGASGTESDEVMVVETTIDDLDPRLYPDVIAATKHAGAYECWLTPVVMKHGRPGVTLTALAPLAAVEPVTAAILRNTTSLGVRAWPSQRTTLERDFVTVSVHGHPLPVKRGWLDGVVVTWQPEYQNAAEVAAHLGLPVKQVLDLAKAAALDAGQKKGSDATDGGDSDVRTNRN